MSVNPENSGETLEESLSPNTSEAVNADVYITPETTTSLPEATVIEFTPAPTQTADVLEFNPNANYLKEAQGLPDTSSDVIEWDGGQTTEPQAEVAMPISDPKNNVIEWTQPAQTNSSSVSTQDQAPIDYVKAMADSENSFVEWGANTKAVLKTQEGPLKEEVIAPETPSTPEERAALDEALRGTNEIVRAERGAINEQRLVEIASTNPEKSTSLLEIWQVVGEWYNARPKKQKILLSVGLTAAGVGAAAVGAAGAGLAITGLMAAKRFVGAAGTYAMLEAGLASAYAKKDKERSALHKKIDSVGAATLAVLIGGGAVSTGVTSLMEHDGSDMIDAVKEKFKGAAQWARDSSRVRQFVGGANIEALAKAVGVSPATETPTPHTVSVEKSVPIETNAQKLDRIIKETGIDVKPIVDQKEIDDLVAAAKAKGLYVETGETITEAQLPAETSAEEIERDTISETTTPGQPPHNLPTEEHVEVPSESSSEVLGELSDADRAKIDKYPEVFPTIETHITAKDVAYSEVDRVPRENNVPLPGDGPGPHLAEKDYEKLRVAVLKQIEKNPEKYTLEKGDSGAFVPGEHLDRTETQKLVMKEVRSIQRWQNLVKKIKPALIAGLIGLAKNKL